MYSSQPHRLFLAKIFEAAIDHAARRNVPRAPGAKGLDQSDRVFWRPDQHARKVRMIVQNPEALITGYEHLTSSMIVSPQSLRIKYLISPTRMRTAAKVIDSYSLRSCIIGPLERRRREECTVDQRLSFQTLG